MSRGLGISRLLARDPLTLTFVLVSLPDDLHWAVPDDIGRFADRTIRTDRGEQAYASLPFWIAHASLTGLPAVSIPIRGSPTGHLPVLSHRPALRGRHRHTSAELATEVIVGHQRPLLLKYPE